MPDEDNLIVRAARQLAGNRRSDDSPGSPLQSTKRLPMGGGLGGGSSNAATTLLGLNHPVGPEPGSLDELAEIGLCLGADVPVFVRGHAALGEGVGETLTNANPPEDWFVVLKPECEINTGKRFFPSKG